MTGLEVRAACVRIRARVDHLEFHVREARAGERSLSSSAFHAAALRETCERIAAEARPAVRVVRA